jgi:MYXO-CTERM domain-containing protein
MGALALLTATSPAEAGFVLQLTSAAGGDSGVITGANGFVMFSGPLSGDTNFMVNVTTGLSKGSLGVPGSTATNAIMDLNSVNVAATGAGVLTIKLSDTDFTDNNQGVTLAVSIGGTLPPNGSLTAQTFEAKSNLNFDTTGFAGPLLSFSTPPTSFSADANKNHGPLGTYSLTEVVTLTFTQAGTVSFDFRSSSTVPEPSSLTLAVLGVLGLVGYGLRRRKARGA